MNQAYQVVVIGAGAAGLVAAERAAARGRNTLLLEKNPRPGVKILMSGGTRCNLTQATDSRGIIAAYGKPGRFLHSALAQLSPQDLVALVEAEGVPTKVEETGKIFPVSNRAADVLAAFTNRLRRTSCDLSLAEPVQEIARDAGFVLITPKRSILAERLIITTGGRSYPKSGTTGDGYGWARQWGHTVVTPRPALAPLTTPAPWIKELQGVTIADVALEIVAAHQSGQRHKPLDRRRGSLLFTHFGLSGPVALDISRTVTAHASPSKLTLLCDLLPDLRADALDEALRQQSASAGKRLAVSLVPEAIPRRLAETLLARAEIAPERRAAELGRGERQCLVEAIKSLAIPLEGARGFEKAEVTAGGVSLDEVDSSTMQSKLVPNLYWAGEVLDLDGPIGGYNFQAAFSTGWLAGISV
jgi:predicted Rossmann fold flavoprotein